jgi:hypothetical protein
VSLGSQTSISHHAFQASSYRHLLELDRAGWAWEWLRRNPDFASTYASRTPLCESGRSIVVTANAAPPALLRWGLHFG